MEESSDYHHTYRWITKYAIVPLIHKIVIHTLKRRKIFISYRDKRQEQVFLRAFDGQV